MHNDNEDEIKKVGEKYNQSIERQDFTSVKDAMNVICSALAENPLPGSYYHSWQCNIAMAFYDEYKRNEEWVSNKHLEGQTATEIDISEIANNAAKNFLNMLIMQVPAPEPELNLSYSFTKEAILKRFTTRKDGSIVYDQKDILNAMEEYAKEQLSDLAAEYLNELRLKSL